MAHQMTKIEVTISTTQGITTYEVLAPITPDHASQVLASSVEFGCAVICAVWTRKDKPSGELTTRLDPREVQ